MHYTSAERPQQPSRFSYDDADEKLAADWAYEQKMLYKKGKLSQDRIKMLNNTEGWTWDIEIAPFVKQLKFSSIYK